MPQRGAVSRHRDRDAAPRIPQPANARPGSADCTAEPDSKSRPTHAEQLLELAAGQEYFSAPDGQTFATVAITEGQPHRETLAVRGQHFKNWLCRRFHEATSKAASSKALHDALNVLDARARFDGPSLPVFCRLGATDGRVYLDLADDHWRAVEITAAGWRVVDVPGVRFRRSPGMRPLPEPEPGGSIDELRTLINLAPADCPLLVGWLLQTLNPSGPYPLLCLHGEQGSAKSTAARVLRSLIDPSSSPLRAEPRNEHDLIINATNSWIIALDNLSHLSPWLSDALCRLATGGGISTRKLYTDADEVIFDATRPVILTGIEDLATRPDLLDDHAEWQGTCRDLLQELGKRIAPELIRSRAWPQNPRALRGQLDRLAPNLRQAGIGIDSERKAGGNRSRLIRLWYLEENPASTPSRSSRPAAPPPVDRDGRDDDPHNFSPSAPPDHGDAWEG